MLRVLPLFPFTVVNIVPALLGVRLKVYTLATFLGILPGTFVFAGVGSGLDAVLDAGQKPDLDIFLQPMVIGPIMALAVLALIPVGYKKMRKMRGK